MYTCDLGILQLLQPCWGASANASMPRCLHAVLMWRHDCLLCCMMITISSCAHFAGVAWLIDIRLSLSACLLSASICCCCPAALAAVVLPPRFPCLLTLLLVGAGSSPFASALLLRHLPPQRFHCMCAAAGTAACLCCAAQHTSLAQAAIFIVQLPLVCGMAVRNQATSPTQGWRRVAHRLAAMSAVLIQSERLQQLAGTHCRVGQAQLVRCEYCSAQSESVGSSAWPSSGAHGSS